MKLRLTPIASAVTLALIGTNALAQQAAPTAPAQAASAAKPTTKLETVVVTGIRASREQSLAAKRNADSVVEVITAEDIGKMPDKNVAASAKATNLAFIITLLICEIVIQTHDGLCFGPKKEMV